MSNHGLRNLLTSATKDWLKSFDVLRARGLDDAAALAATRLLAPRTLGYAVRTTTNRWIIAGNRAGAVVPGYFRVRGPVRVRRTATAIVGRLTPGDEARFARLAESQGPGRVAFIYLASDGGDLSAAAMSRGKFARSE